MRPSIDEWAMGLAQLTATRATCLRRQVGCVLLDARNHVLATGYNGVARGQPHCNEHVQDAYPHACVGAAAASGTALEACEAVHAEQNALLQCRDVYVIHTAYVTTSPCVTCTKLLLNTSCERVVFLTLYPHADAARRLWEKASRQWVLMVKNTCLQRGGSVT